MRGRDGFLCDLHLGEGHSILRQRPLVLNSPTRGNILSTRMSRFLNVLRSWLVMVAVIAAGNTIQSFRDHSFLSEKLYTGKPALVNGLQARTFGIWTLLSSIIRCTCAVDIQNRTLYHITLWTFILALIHFLSESFVYQTAPITIGVMAPLLVAGFSILGMLVGFQYIEDSQEVASVPAKKRI
ncbi:ergosterol biosynthetic protein 28 homolog isoform X2 [Hypanus sabinus]|uniref:ergosterol biosynthetic protein 28 homolog isoform X2 n=1 Tax=Hypanus sabinus TaxID=79690 RepID=UPI0028C4DFC4|nr:ergosterol biosynthetic protein 28 homolog isoform X2 [Hypanus sabinus]